jgi:hypothetical protein
MRKTILAVCILIAVWLAWLIWPLTALYALVRAVESRDAAGITEQIDPAAIRRSVTDQIIDTYERLTGARFRRGGTAAVAGIAVEPLMAQVVSTEGIAFLLQSGWVKPELVERPYDTRGLSARALGSAWQIFLNSQRGFDRYSISFPPDKPKAHRIELEWRMRGPKWRLAVIRLPDTLLERVTQKIIKETRGL